MTSGDLVGVGVLGATGYTGAEVVRLLAQHPRAKLVALSARKFVGQPAHRALPFLPSLDVICDGENIDPKAWRKLGVRVVFACLPHGMFAERAKDYLDVGIRVIDLSADFRLPDNEAYAQHYGWAHPNPTLLSQANYGLCEWTDEVTPKSTLVANPGCYATAILLGLLPPADEGWLADGVVVINAMSGVSGAGRSARLGSHYVECAEGVSPYKVGASHQHLGEIGATLHRVCHVRPEIVFSPHLVPMTRGILATMALPLRRPVTPEVAQELFESRYADTPFVHVVDGDRLCQTRFVRGSNRCDVAVRVVASGHMLLVFSAIDNLLKGAAGQAVQNFNRLCGFDETLGLPLGGALCP